MPTIELTDEQVETLREVIALEIDDTDDELRSCDPGDADHISYTHHRSTLQDILELLEIA